ASRSRSTTRARAASCGKSLAQPTMNSSASRSRSLFLNGEGSMELNNCFNSPTCTSITEHLGAMGSPADALLSVMDEGIAGFARVTGQPKSQHYLPDMILAIQPLRPKSVNSETVKDALH